MALMYYEPLATDRSGRTYQCYERYDDAEKACEWFDEIENIYQVRLELMALSCYDGPDELKSVGLLGVERKFIPVKLKKLEEEI